ncbi:NUDIX hydrolase [Paenibacillus radicis (ex Xue et al. 2023)]|uniref:NUDIX hydrolase n=1 Tax=Paenibacillus radicis (ex Xue et al. 2023) TaxID=2972489 RepID=A0ABT1YIC3_9BACL|nr:NUDIX hydrolase [Paenibacillus radicis (ex Xue et al. 2023)]MCR8632174.1 NUDIX hydrolase [Paenibacillus radicis (ex Xue et al. 2023)]
MNENEKWHRHLGAYGICIYEEKLLVIQKGSGPYIGRYDLPGGTVEANESLTEALKREFIEEAGINVGIKRNVGVCDYLIPYELPKRGTSHIHHVAVLYLVHYIDGMLTMNPDQFEGQDSLGALWVSINDIGATNSSPLVIQVIEWLKTERLSLEVQRLDDWVVLEK